MLGLSDSKNANADGNVVLPSAPGMGTVSHLPRAETFYDAGWLVYRGQLPIAALGVINSTCIWCVPRVDLMWSSHHNTERADRTSTPV